MFAFALIPPARLRVALSLLVFAAAIFRSEVALLLATTGLYLLLTHQTTIPRLVRPFLISFAVAIAVSVPSTRTSGRSPSGRSSGLLLQRRPRLLVQLGRVPWHYYFSSALPRLLVNPLTFLVLIPLALSHPATSRPAAGLVVPPLLFVAIYSLQPHKEARFVFYAVPPLTAAAAQGANLIFARRSKSPLYALASAALVLSVLASLAASTGMLLLSSLNYPGGDALRQLHALVASDRSGGGASVTSVHTDVLSCMTGTEDKAVLADPAFWSRFDYVLAEDPASVRGGQWETVGVVQGYAGVEILRPGSKARSGDGGDEEEGEGNVLGRGLVVQRVRDLVRRLTGGWWVGPRMEPRIRILKRTKDAGAGARIVSQ
ncbi:alg9-like mannosyltransferase [Colletotrichum tofieldiae]|nr:alg9-like mannosyltransferase [Colletotrichum tofieldiae]